MAEIPRRMLYLLRKVGEEFQKKENPSILTRGTGSGFIKRYKVTPEEEGDLKLMIGEVIVGFGRAYPLWAGLSFPFKE